MKKIAIIGGGAAGVGALISLASHHDVTLFESSDYLGGHAFTFTDSSNSPIAVDLGVEYFHERLSPNIFCLLSNYNLDTYVAPLSLACYQQNANPDDFWSNLRIAGNMKQAFHQEMNRFQSDMLSVLQPNQTTMRSKTIGDFLDSKHYSKAFQLQVVLPIMTIFSGCLAPSLDYSLTYVALSFSMNLLSFYSSCHWRKVSGGVSQLYQAIVNQYSSSIQLNQRIAKVTHFDQYARVHLQDGSTADFDEVIFACHADQALALIHQPSSKQEALLGHFEYVNVSSSLHTDDQALQLHSTGPEYFQFALSDTLNRQFTGHLSRVNHHLLPYHGTKPYFVSFDAEKLLDQSKVMLTKRWKLPKLRPIDLHQKMQIRSIQGKQHFWYCGTDYSITGHEGALVSGMVVGQRLGGEYPFEHDWFANMQFQTIKSFMGVYSKKGKLAASLGDTLFGAIKKTGAHQHFSHRFVKDILF